MTEVVINNHCIVDAYYVDGCKIDYKTIFSGYVLNINGEPIIDSIKRKLGRKEILCEKTNEGFDYNFVDIYSIPLSELTLGDIMLVTGNYTIPKPT